MYFILIHYCTQLSQNGTGMDINHQADLYGKTFLGAYSALVNGCFIANAVVFSVGI